MRLEIQKFPSNMEPPIFFIYLTNDNEKNSNSSTGGLRYGEVVSLIGRELAEKVLNDGLIECSCSVQLSNNPLIVQEKEKESIESKLLEPEEGKQNESKPEFENEEF